MSAFKSKIGKGILSGLEEMDSGADIVNIELERLVPDEKNFYSISNINELAEDIKQNGLYHNLVVRPFGEGYKIISGERRYRACKHIGMERVPCKVRDDIDNEVDAEIILIQANAKTRELTDIEKVKQAKRLEELYSEKKRLGQKLGGKVRDLVGKDMGMSGSQVRRLLNVDKLIPEFKELIEEDKIATSAAEQFSGLDTEAQKDIYNSLISLGKKINRDDAKRLKEDWQKEKELIKSKLDKLKSKSSEAEESGEGDTARIKADIELDVLLRQYHEICSKLTINLNSYINNYGKLPDDKKNKLNQSLKLINESLLNE